VDTVEDVDEGHWRVGHLGKVLGLTRAFNLDRNRPFSINSSTVSAGKRPFNVNITLLLIVSERALFCCLHSVTGRQELQVATEKS
jgi:hypothetical protein